MQVKRKVVYCRTRFISFHRWPDAPAPFAHLAFPHRHEFHVEAAVEVSHSNRDVEFQFLKREVSDYCDFHLRMNDWGPEVEVMSKSCEMLAQEIAEHLAKCGYKVWYVDVNEDGENGARVYFHEKCEPNV